MKISRILPVLAVAAGTLNFTGCASIVTGQNQSVTVETPGCPDATCELVNDKGKWYVSKTPGSATVHRAYSDMTVLCRKGDIEKISSMKSATKGMAAGNIIFGGVIGAAVDVGTGAAYDYPEVISVPMECGARVAESGEAKAN